MHDPERMSVLQSIGDLDEQLDRFPEGETTACKVIGECEPFHEIANEVRRTVGHSDFVNSYDGRKAKLSHATGFAQKAVEVTRIGADVARARHLYGDDTVKFSVARFEHGA